VYNPEYCKKSGRLTVAPNDPKAVVTLFHIRGMDLPNSVQSIFEIQVEEQNARAKVLEV